MDKKYSGILLPIFSLPGKYGIGSFGDEAYRFVDFIAKCGFKYWQILPLNPTGYGDSPYQSYSSYAGNPYFIDLESLYKKDLLTKEELLNAQYVGDTRKINYNWLYQTRKKVLQSAVNRFDLNDEQYKQFVEENNFWLKDYALFMAVKVKFGGVCIQQTPQEILKRDEKILKTISIEYENEITYQRVVQYFFYSQFKALKSYLNDKGILLFGDMPIYVATDSVDVWVAPQFFQLDEQYQPTNVAGCPPDGFSKDGQLWGNVLYNWEALQEDNFNWWKKRIEHCLKLYDLLRIDHFIGFKNYYSISTKNLDAKNGVYYKAPGKELFTVIKKELNNPPIVAEDLGALTPDVVRMLDEIAYPGMKVLHFVLYDKEQDPLQFKYNSICYTATHDSETTAGWFKSLKLSMKWRVYKRLRKYPGRKMVDKVISMALASSSKLAIILFQDLLYLDNRYRINTPSTVGNNWVYRFGHHDYSDKLVEKTRKKLTKYHRETTIGGNQ